MNDLQMMQNQDDWPRWPILPVKRRVKNSSPECAVMVAGEGPVVRKIGLYDLTQESIEKAPKETFPTFQALVAAGWIVD